MYEHFLSYTVVFLRLVKVAAQRFKCSNLIVKHFLWLLKESLRVKINKNKMSRVILGVYLL